MEVAGRQRKARNPGSRAGIRRHVREQAFRRPSSAEGTRTELNGVPKRQKQMDNLRAQVVIHGFVQGVWFRQSTKDEADRLGVAGWVRNLPDGTVEAVFEGDKKKVEEIVGWCHRGPSGAQVTGVDVAWQRPTGEFPRFEIRYGR